MEHVKTYEDLLAENEAMRWQLEEATETIDAIRSGQVDALVVQGESGHELYSLKTADQTYRVFIEKMNEGAITVNDAGMILYCNSKFAGMVGLPLSKVLGAPFTSFIPDEQQQQYAKIMADGWITDAKAEFLIRGEEQLVPCQLSITTLQLDEGAALSIILTDLSYQKEVQELLKANNERLEESNSALEKSNHDLLQFASVASHDLQEPLRKMLIFGDLLKAKLGKDIDADAGRYLSKIVDSSARMKRLTSDILSYSRIGVDNISYTATDLHEVMQEIIDDFEILIAEKNAEIELSKLPVIEVAAGQIRQLFQNLLSNALKFSMPGRPPHIIITCEPPPDDSHCIISFADNGIGFDTHYSDRIFALFQRLNTKDKYDGSGIGLAVAKKIVESHAGHISVVSTPGEGSTFRVMLPCKR